MNTSTLVTRHKFREVINYDCIIILSYLFFSSPFLFSGIYFSNFLIPYFIKLLILILILTRSVKYHLSPLCVLFIVLSFFYTFYHVTEHPNSAGQNIADLQDLFFAILSFNIIKKTKNRLLFVDFLLFVSFVIAILLLIESFLFLIMPSLFTLTELVGYEVFFNELLGIVSIDKLRPCWFFAEPSYCGAFFMWCVFIFRNYPFPRRKHKIFYYIAVLSALVSTASFGSFVVLGLCLMILLAKDFFKFNNKIIILGVSVGVIFFMSFFQNFEPADSSLIHTNSLNARQERVIKGKEMRESMQFIDILFGLGDNAGGMDDDIGLSDAYNKMYIENGVLFLLVYLLVIYHLLKDDIVVFSAVIFSLMTVIVQIFPLTLFTVVIASMAKVKRYYIKQV